MPDINREPILTGRKARQYVGAVEGLIFDPQIPSMLKVDYGWGVGVTDVAWKIAPEGAATLAHKEKTLKALSRRWNIDVSYRFEELLTSPSEKEVSLEDRKYVEGTPFHKISNERALVLESDYLRRYRIGLSWVEDETTAITRPFLELRQIIADPPSAQLIIGADSLYRADGELVRYVAGFEEQQRLLLVSQMLADHATPITRDQA